MKLAKPALLTHPITLSLSRQYYILVVVVSESGNDAYGRLESERQLAEEPMNHVRLPKLYRM